MAFGKRRNDQGAGEKSAADYSRNSASYGSGRHASGVAPVKPSANYAQNAGKTQVQAVGRASHASHASEYSRNSQNYTSKRNKKMSVGAKVGLVVSAVVVCALSCAGTAGALYVNSINSNMQKGYSAEQQIAIKDSLVQTESFDKPFYMLLIGSDRRANNEAMGARSDTNVLARVDAKKGVISMLSIPRDTKITYKGSTMKFNAAYTYGGGAAGTIEATKELTGVDIAHYVEVNFQDMRNLVDAIGGIEVDVPYRIEDKKAGQSVIEPGKQTLNGRQALTFARSRHYADGDFTRTSNQRIVIQAMAKKVLKLPATELLGVLQTASECVTTDLSVMDVYSLAMQFMDIGVDKVKMYSAMAPSTTGTEGGVSYVFSDSQGLADMISLMDQGKDPSKVKLTSGASIASALPTTSKGTGGKITASASDENASESN
ncbi:MAG: LCP family protein [Coriobacteriia bacterium]|nr:LCP family protein [Coriobacteriia bacterium]